MSIIEKAVERLAHRPTPVPEPLDPVWEASVAGGGRIPGQQGLADTDARSPAAVPAATEPARLVPGAVAILGAEKEFLLSPEGGRSRTAEEFRMIKRPLLMNAFERPADGTTFPNLIMVTSSLQAEGKTFTVAESCHIDHA